MERPHSPRNLAHRMGRWSGLHPWRAILGWVAFVAVCFVAGNAVGTTQIDDSHARHRRVRPRARSSSTQAGFNDKPGTEMVFVQSPPGPLTDKALAASTPT